MRQRIQNSWFPRLFSGFSKHNKSGDPCVIIMKLLRPTETALSKLNMMYGKIKTPNKTLPHPPLWQFTFSSKHQLESHSAQLSNICPLVHLNHVLQNTHSTQHRCRIVLLLMRINASCVRALNVHPKCLGNHLPLGAVLFVSWRRAAPNVSSATLSKVRSSLCD